MSTMVRMGVIGLGFALTVGVAQADSKYTCYRHVDGGSTGGSIQVHASSEAEAERKAMRRYEDDLGYRVDSVNCSLSW